VHDIDTVLRSCRQNYTLTFSRAAAEQFQELIRAHVHPSMEYKLLPKYRGCFTPGVQQTDMRRVLLEAPIIAIAERDPGKYNNRFDIEVEGTHNYFVDDVMVHNSPVTTTGGKALKFYASLRLDVSRTGAVKDKEEVVGASTKVKVVKNKTAPPHRVAEFNIVYGEGIDHVGMVLDRAAEQGIIDKSGAWYAYKGQKIGQGRENARLYLRSQPEVFREVEAAVRGSE
jgi:recombination protein RecA